MIDEPGDAGKKLNPLLSFLLGSFVFFSTFSIAGTQVSLAVACAVWLVLIVTGGARCYRRTPIDIPLLCFVGATLCAVVFSAKRWESFLNCRNIVLLVIPYIFGFAAGRTNLRKKLFLVLLVSGTASALYGIVIFAMGKGGGALGRTSGSFSTAMTFGGVMLLLCSIFLAFAAGRGIGNRLRIAVSAAVLASGCALLLSFTRSSWVGMFVSVVTIFSVTRKKLLAPFAVLVIVVFFLMPGRYRERVTSIWDTEFRTNVQRIELLRGGWAIARGHPIVGVGTMDLAETYERYKPPGAVHVHGHMHNNFLQEAVTKGIIGLAALLYLLVSFFRLAAGNLGLDLSPQERAWVVGSLGALAGFTVNGLFEYNLGDAEVIMMLYMIIGSNLSFRFDGRAGA